MIEVDEMGPEFPPDGSDTSTAREVARRGFAVERRETADGGTVLACLGELDLATMPAFEDALGRAEAAGGAIILDLSRLDFIDSRALAMILALDRCVREAGGRLTIVRGPDPVNRMFELTGLLNRLEFVEDPPASNGAPKRAGADTIAPAALGSAAYAIT